MTRNLNIRNYRMKKTVRDQVWGQVINQVKY
jgi:hypothetical protein